MAEEQEYEIHGEIRKIVCLARVKATSKEEAMEKAQRLEYPNEYVENSKFVVAPDEDQYEGRPRTQFSLRD